MDSHATEIECPRREIAAYIDGELSPRDEIELEKHVAACRLCATELNEQKRLLCALDFALEGEREIRLPENFARVVVANAESAVSGLRSPNERFNAGFVVAALFLLFLVGLGGEVKTLAAAFTHFGEQIFTVSVFTAHLIYNVAVGASIILRTFGSQVIFDSTTSGAFTIIFLLVFLFAASRFASRSSQS